MMTIVEQAEGRVKLAQMMIRDIVPICDNVQHACAVMIGIMSPTIAGGMLALPDYRSNRPDEMDAIRYAERLVNRQNETSSAYCVKSEISVHSGEAYDVTVWSSYGEHVVTVWLENGEVYGEC